MVRSQALNRMTIGKLAAAGGVGVETIRYYQRRGLLAEPDRNGGVRRYDETNLSSLRFIRSAQIAGFTLEEIGELLSLDATNDRKRAHQIATARLKELDIKISQLQNARRALQHLATECSSSSQGRCPIIEAFTNQAML